MEPGGPGTPIVQRNRDELDNHENFDERIVFFLWQLWKQFHSSNACRQSRGLRCSECKPTAFPASSEVISLGGPIRVTVLQYSSTVLLSDRSPEKTQRTRPSPIDQSLWRDIRACRL